MNEPIEINERLTIVRHDVETTCIEFCGFTIRGSDDYVTVILPNGCDEIGIPSKGPVVWIANDNEEFYLTSDKIREALKVLNAVRAIGQSLCTGIPRIP